ncbi:MAG TPA: PQQ-dependent sugar dehydrogenase [Patescibacteria group bacterium]
MKKIWLIPIFFVLLLTGVFISRKQTVKVPSLNNPQASIKPSANSYQISSGSVPSIPFSLPSGYTIHIFASNLTNPRDMIFTPNGTLLVSSPKENEVYALPDKNQDGVADQNIVIISGENHPHGLAFYNTHLFVADVDRVVRYTWNDSTLSASKDKNLFSLPENNDHNNRTILFDKNGNLFVSVGSTCNVCHESSPFSATVLKSNENGDSPTIFATGLRNAAFLALNPTTGEIWATGMGRDYLGDNLPPDEINILMSNQNYGWPYCYGNRIHDNNFDPRNTHSCSSTTAPIYEIPAHSAPLGLTFINSSQFPSDEQGDLLVAYHGDWNRSTPIGFKIVHLRVNGNNISGSDDFLTGFLQSSNASDALGRPADMIFDSKGNLYISDDKAGNIYIVQKKG